MEADTRIANRRITLMGLGRHGGGVAAARWLAQQGAHVTVTDLAAAQALAESVEALTDVTIARWALGGHQASDFVTAETVVVNPAVRPDNPLVELARAGGATITSEIELFLERCPALVVGVTGSNGKSSTATMLADVLRAGGRRTWLGGNIGSSLLPALGEIQPTDFVVLELSSFQLAQLSDQARFPAAAIITGCTPNHLDWHGTLAAYAAAKRRLVEQLPAGGMVVLNRADCELSSWRVPAAARLLAPWPLTRVPKLLVAGEHQRTNASLVAAMAEAIGIEPSVIERALAAFCGLPHRQEPAGSVAGRHFIDDSKSTSPEATLAALAACEGPVWVLIGGQDKQVPLEPLCRELAQRTKGVACFGAVGPAVGKTLKTIGNRRPVTVVERLEEALDWCWRQSEPGDTILLSPAAASLDQFRDFVHRAEVFRAWIAGRGQI
jgi:UDP-N-acetylmuramoylalanine--D-glutamate ligase